MKGTREQYLQRIFEACKACEGKSYPVSYSFIYNHGRAVSMRVDGVTISQYGVTVYNRITFSDGFESEFNSYSMDGVRFYNQYLNK